MLRWLGIFDFLCEAGASALDPEMRLRLAVGVRVLLGVVQHKQLDVKN